MYTNIYIYIHIYIYVYIYIHIHIYRPAAPRGWSARGRRGARSSGATPRLSERDKWGHCKKKSMSFDRGAFWVLPLTCFFLAKSARAYLFPQSIKIHYFCSGPISVDPICPHPTRCRASSTRHTSWCARRRSPPPGAAWAAARSSCFHYE